MRIGGTNTEFNVAQWLLANHDASKVAVMTPNSEHTYAELTGAVDRISRLLVERGARKGDRVILVADNSCFWVSAYLSVIRAGMVVVPLAPRMATAEVRLVLERAEPAMVIVQGKYTAPTRTLFSAYPIITDADLAEFLCSGTAPMADVELPVTVADDLAAIMFTSGSTGRPRGVMVSHRNIAANTQSIIEYLSLTASDRMMTVLPFHYCFGTSLLHTHLRAGGSLVLDPRFMFPEKVLENMQQSACTGFAGVPSHFQILLRNSGLAKMQFPALRYVQQAGGHLAPMFVEELRRALPQTQIFIMYGQTEATARLSYLPPDMLDRKFGSIGKGIPGVKLRVLDPDGNDVPPGQTGELVAEGDNVCLGYWRDNDEPRSFRNGKLYTGDLGRVDEDGYIFIVDRLKDILKCGGKRVSCRTVEDVLLSCDALLEAAVVGMPDDVLGEAVKAYVVPRVKTPVAELTQAVLEVCRKKLPPQLLPKEIVVLSSLPKSAAGKVLKASLKEAPKPVSKGVAGVQ